MHLDTIVGGHSSCFLDAFGALAIPEFGPKLIVGSLSFLSFSALGITSAVFMVRDGDGTPPQMDQTNKLVVSGPYRFVRNPKAIAGIGQGISIAIAFWSLPVLVYSLLGVAVWHFAVRPCEERDMLTRFGEPYRQYRQDVMCWCPTLRKRAP
ncbi:MAG: isoprenylcysteine carboxylmethyltransferase family protein [Planctomycetota bacterium]|nr:isoprenylcysteine carboxylmethyltransferase family protein [Planctomycetota bacterium]